MKRLFAGFMLIGALLAACGTPAGPVVSEVTPTAGVPTVVPVPTHIPVDIPEAQRAAIAALAAQLGLSADQITVVSSEAVTWPDGCLGVVHMGVMCTQNHVPGFRIVLLAGGKQYEYHTNQDGSTLVDATGAPTQAPAVTPVPAPTSTPVNVPTGEPTHIPVDIPPVQRAAIAAAITTLGLPADEVKLVTIEPVDWPDACLGVTHMGMMCAKGPVPGFRIVLEANGKQYEFHTNLDASQVAPANGPAVEVPDAIVIPVKAALATALGIAADDIQVVSTQIIEWPDGCLGSAQAGVACSQIVTPGYIVVLQANGQQYEYHTNGDASIVKPASLALSWQRNGGIAGFADSLTVYLSGEVNAGWSNGSTTSTLSALSKDQQTLLRGWMAKYGTVSINQQDQATADAMAVNLTLLGTGSDQPSAAEQRAMLDWAQGVAASLKH